ncbi:MAG: indole-3-glycerol phosphate synthase [Haloquadratum sp. J07HQX50]|jgi:indole-3-glycerol phosphate synthase (EC 4.1.1.48)|nr:MAG: indole-3-glycerol phosphate synthase [Haloquadratum sp. J07HQX50]
MDVSDESLAPAVRSILATARDRSGSESAVTVDARSFSAARRAAERAGQIPVIAEVKPTSPTAEQTHTGDPVEYASKMIEGGACALSVLTEPSHFNGDTKHLTQIREAVDVPVLRKDFLLREAQLNTAAADLILLIARFLGTAGADSLAEMHTAAVERGFRPLVEVHTASELEHALEIGAQVIGINNRDLGALSVDLSTFESLAQKAPSDVTLIAESGISTPQDVQRMRNAGADALLIGTAIMSGDIQQTTSELTTPE